MSWLSGIFTGPTPPAQRSFYTLDAEGRVFLSDIGKGTGVSVRNALSIPSVYAAVSSVADCISTLPLPVMRRGEQGGEKDYQHPVYALLNRSPNPIQTAVTWRRSMVFDILCYGEHFSEIVYLEDGITPAQLWRIDPTTVVTTWNGKSLVYSVNGQEIPSSSLIHVLGFSLDGIRGTSAFSLCKDSLGMTLALERFGSGFFRNSARPGGILTVPPGRGPEDLAADKASWDAANAGADNAFKTAVLPDGYAWKPLSVPPEEGQYAETRVQQLRETQRICRVPPSITNDYERATWSNIQYQRKDLVELCLRPVVVSIEQELNRKLGMSEDTYIEHVLEGLLRGSFTEQIDALTKAAGGAFYTPNECRKILGLPAIDGGDTIQHRTTGGNNDQSK